MKDDLQLIGRASVFIGFFLLVAAALGLAVRIFVIVSGLGG